MKPSKKAAGRGTSPVTSPLAMPGSGQIQTQITPPSHSLPDGASVLTEAERRAMIEVTAYLRAESRGFAPGHELEDWVAAELQVDEFLHGAVRRDTGGAATVAVRRAGEG